jgi:hypothetical protein
MQRSSHGGRGVHGVIEEGYRADLIVENNVELKSVETLLSVLAPFPLDAEHSDGLTRDNTVVQVEDRSAGPKSKLSCVLIADFVGIKGLHLSLLQHPQNATANGADCSSGSARPLTWSFELMVSEGKDLFQ